MLKLNCNKTMNLCQNCANIRNVHQSAIHTSLKSVTEGVKHLSKSNTKDSVHTEQVCKHSDWNGFTQDKPVLHNPYIHDSLLKGFLRRNLPSEVFQPVDADLKRLGDRVVSEIDPLGRQCELNPPRLVQYDAWGNRVDDVITCKEWQTMKDISAEEGLVATGYERQHQEWSRIVQVAKLFLFSPSSGLYSCPLAMTDGAAKVIETHLDNDADGDAAHVFQNALRKLRSRDPNEFWTSGQWMTEKKGGSDVASGTETRAIAQDDGTYKLYGYKWFTSATDADMALTLARIVDHNGNVPPGSKGLSLFYLETRTADDGDSTRKLNGLRIERLKQKLGTKQLPTAEMTLDGTVAHLVGQASRGVRLISGMLTMSRIHNCVMSASSTRRVVHLARDYATRRHAFGSPLADHRLHVQTLARMETESRASTLLVLELARLLGLAECRPDHVTDDQLDLLRVLTPVAKLYTAKQAIAVISEGLESFGGAGYLEDTGLPTHLRDAQVLSIWEGTTNVLALDTLRAIAKSNGQVLNSFFFSVNERLAKVSDCGVRELRQPIAKLNIAAGDLRAFISQTSTMGANAMFASARDFSFSLARIFSALLMLEHATWRESTTADIHAAITWCAQDLCPAATHLRSGAFTDAAASRNRQLVYEAFDPNTSEHST